MDLGRGRFFVDPALAPLFESEMLHGIGDVHIGARDSCLLQSSIEKVARWSDEGAALLVLLVAGLLSHKNNTRRTGAFSENRLRGVTVKIASLACLSGILKGGQCPDFRNKGLSSHETDSWRATGHPAIGASN